MEMRAVIYATLMCQGHRNGHKSIPENILAMETKNGFGTTGSQCVSSCVLLGLAK